MTAHEFAERLLALWSAAHEHGLDKSIEGFDVWSGATKDILIDLGMEYVVHEDALSFEGDYVIKTPEERRDHRDWLDAEAQRYAGMTSTPAREPLIVRVPTTLMMLERERNKEKP